MQKILSYTIAASVRRVVDFLVNPYHLKQWTVHRHLYLLNEECYEAVNVGEAVIFTKIEVIKELDGEKERLRFLWTKEGNVVKFFDFEIRAIDTFTTSIDIKLLKLPVSPKRERLERLLHIELELLEKILNGHPLSMKKEDALFMESYQQQLKNE
jgi:hypothetical protein